jgi:histidinol-phosphate aminotransferase
MTGVDAIDALDFVRAIAPYQAGKPIAELAREFGLDPACIVKLASNENPLGMAPAARRALLALAQSQPVLADLGRYPDSNGFDLKAALAARYQVPPGWITLGNGSNDILELAAAAMLERGRSAVYSQYSFGVYALAVQARGARAIVVPAHRSGDDQPGHDQFGHDLDAMAAAIAPDTRLLYLANPNNPTGTYVPGAAIERLLARVAPQVVVVLDEAYNEYLRPEQRFDSAALVRSYPNLLVSRTFSKAYGLASLRVGYGLAQPELTELLNRVRHPFNVNAFAQAAAVAALADIEFLDRSYQLNLAGLEQLGAGCRRLGLRVVPSCGNFLLIHVGAAARVYHELLQRGVIVRPVASYGLPEWLRVTVGLEQENQRFLDALAAALAPLPETAHR